MQIQARLCFLAIGFAVCPGTLPAQLPPNSNSTYQQLRSLSVGGEVITVHNLEFSRDAAVFTFTTGNIAFYSEVNGKVTGAVFKGQGHLHLAPPTAEERHNLKILNESEEFDEDFDQVVLRFTDATAAELRKGAVAGSGGAGTADRGFANAASDVHSYLRTKLKSNIDLRLLEDVLSSSPGGYFLAIIHGKQNAHLFFTIDPHGAPDMEPEEVSLMSFNDWGPAFLTAFHLSSDSAGSNEQNEPVRVDNEDLDTTIEKGGFLTGLATVHLTALKDGVAVVPLNLYPTLRVSKAETDNGAALDFVQEKKEEDADFAVILAKPLKKGETAVVRVAYGGKDVVRDEGGANYYPIAREKLVSQFRDGPGRLRNLPHAFSCAQGTSTDRHRNQGAGK